MASANSKELYIPLTDIRGKQNADGTYTLTAADIKNLNDMLYLMKMKIQGGLTISDLTSDAAAILVTDDSITMEVSNGSESSTIKIKNNGIEIASVNVTFTGVVTFTDLSGSGSTTINGDNITTGTITGVELISDNGTRQVDIDDGEVAFGYRSGASVWQVGRVFSYDGSSFWIKTESGSVMKLLSDSTMSIDSTSGTVYIGASASGNKQVYIGTSGGRVDLYGDVYVNGVLQT